MNLSTKKLSNFLKKFKNMTKMGKITQKWNNIEVLCSQILNHATGPNDIQIYF